METDVTKDRPTLAAGLAVLAAVAVSIAIPTVQALGHIGLSAAAFSHQGDSTLRAATYAFSIWGVIYAGMIAVALFCLRPPRGSGPVLAALAWPFAGAALGCGLWIITAAAGQQALSCLVLIATWSLAVTALVRARLQGPQGWGANLACLAVGLLTGWLTDATALNLITAATALGLIPAGIATIAGGVTVAGALLVALLVGRAGRTFSYELAVAWGLVAVFVAEQHNHVIPAWMALAGAVVLLLIAVARLVRRG